MRPAYRQDHLATTHICGYHHQAHKAKAQEENGVTQPRYIDVVWVFISTEHKRAEHLAMERMCCMSRRCMNSDGLAQLCMPTCRHYCSLPLARFPVSQERYPIKEAVDVLSAPRRNCVSKGAGAILVRVCQLMLVMPPPSCCQDDHHPGNKQK